MKRIGRAAVVVATAALTGVGFLASPASAAQVTAYHMGASAAFDNNPGNGRESWVWIWSGPNQQAYVDYMTTKGRGQAFAGTGPWASFSMSLDNNVWAVRACALANSQWSCGSWKYS